MTSYDVVGVGLGPFNLGLAALLDPIDDVSAVFFEAEPRFNWHPGLLLPGVTLQVPFLADLVTLADPTSRYSFLNYLQQRNRLYRFYFHERFHIARREYQAYTQWVAQNLPSCRFGQQVVDVRPDGSDTWAVRVQSSSTGDIDEHTARAVVFGVGSRPHVPSVAHDVQGDEAFHTADYLNYRDKALAAHAVTVVGSGQSAGEVVADLLESGLGHRMTLDWFTRSTGFLPMEYSKLGLEHFTPEYITHFHDLPPAVRDRVRAGQDLLYRGLSAPTSARIYDLLYEATIDAPDPPVTYSARCALAAIEPSPEPGRRWRLRWQHLDQDQTFTRDTDIIVFATGYQPTPPPVAPAIVAYDASDRPCVTADYRLRLADGSASTLFVQNAELHTHGIGTPDLGLGAHRNSVIVNAVAGREVYPARQRTVFQQFGVPE